MPVTRKLLPYLKKLEYVVRALLVKQLPLFSRVSRKTVLLKSFVIVLPALLLYVKHLSRDSECNTSSTCDVCTFLNSPRLRLGSLYDFKVCLLRHWECFTWGSRAHIKLCICNCLEIAGLLVTTLFNIHCAGARSECGCVYSLHMLAQFSVYSSHGQPMSFNLGRNAPPCPLQGPARTIILSKCSRASTATIRFKTPKTSVKDEPIKIMAEPGYAWIRGTAISPQPSPASFAALICELTGKSMANPSKQQSDHHQRAR